MIPQRPDPHRDVCVYASSRYFNAAMHPKALLIDLDGVIYVQEKLIPGAVEAVRLIQTSMIPHRFVTNTTTHTRQQLINRLKQVGIQTPLDYLFTAPSAAARFLRGIPSARSYFFTHPDLAEEFDGIPRDDVQPTHVVIGDVGEQFNYEMMNRVFNMLHNGAEILALQKNRFWITRDGLKLDAGAFVAALEYATGKTARVFGKPSAEFFRQACADMELPPRDVTMIGDDLKADIAGAASVGLQTIFVRTGKDGNTLVERRDEKPDVVLNSIADLPELFRNG